MKLFKLLGLDTMPLMPEVGKTAEETDTSKSAWWTFKKLRGSVLVVLGYLLSPLSWWNDLVFNLPVAYGFGYLCDLISPGLLMPGAIVGYWLSNVIGILLMQAGLLDVVQKEPRQRSFKKEVFTGLLSSTAYTAVIVLLLQLKVLETPVLPLHF